MRIEKLCKQFTGPATRRHIKKQTRKLRRRRERRDPENAPTRLRDLTQGWSD